MGLTVLNVAYPLAPVGPGAVGGAEQILGHLDRGLIRLGHRSIVLACEGSRCDGRLVTVPRPRGVLDERTIHAARARHGEAIRNILAREAVDVVHLHGFDFHAYLPPEGVPALVTLHCPLSWYPADALAIRRADTWLHCVSRSQHAACGPHPALLPPIENGVPAAPVLRGRSKRRFALMLSRISPEKGIHIGMDAARRAGIPLLIAGEVFPYEAHLKYFANEIAPRLDPAWCCFLGPADLSLKQRLLATARCLLVPSLAAETSSLAARESLASGTPVIAFAQGALGDTVEHGRTGFLVRDVEEMAAAIGAASALDPRVCRARATERFSLQQMILRYAGVYELLARRQEAARGAA